MNELMKQMGQIESGKIRKVEMAENDFRNQAKQIGAKFTFDGPQTVARVNGFKIVSCPEWVGNGMIEITNNN